MFARISIALLSICLLWVAGCGNPPAPPSALRIALVGKARNMPGFAACEQGAQQAARELGVQVFVETPFDSTAAAQVELIDSLVMRRMDAIAVMPINPLALVPALQRARQNGVHVITFDSDADEKRSEREWFVRTVSDEAVAQSLVEIMARFAGAKATTAIVTASWTADEQLWIRDIRAVISQRYPLMHIKDIKRVEDDRQAASQAVEEVLKENPDLNGLFALSPNTLAGTAEAMKASGRKGVITVTGIGLPNMMREYVQQGIVRSFVMWNPADLGYLTVFVAQQSVLGKLKAGDTRLEAGRLGTRPINGKEILLSDPLQFNIGNVDKFSF